MIFKELKKLPETKSQAFITTLSIPYAALNVIMLSVILISVIMLSTVYDEGNDKSIMLNVVMLSVTMPKPAVNSCRIVLSLSHSQVMLRK
jgi:hypothetical protein